MVARGYGPHWRPERPVSLGTLEELFPGVFEIHVDANFSVFFFRYARRRESTGSAGAAMLRERLLLGLRLFAALARTYIKP